MTPAQERLVLDTLPTVEHVAAAFVRTVAPSVDRESVRSAAVEGLVVAACRFDGRRTWDGYCRLMVMGRMLDEVRAQDPAKNRSTTAAAARVTTTTVPLSTEHDVPARADAYAQARTRIDLIAALRRLAPRTRYVIVATEIRDRFVADVADELGVHEARLSQIRTAAFATLRTTLS